MISLHYSHSGSKEQVSGPLSRGREGNCGNGGCDAVARQSELGLRDSDASLQGDFEKLVASALPVREGDITNFVVTEKGFWVLFNGRPVVSFSDSRLGNLILEGFIGAHPPSEDLRAGLLGVR